MPPLADLQRAFSRAILTDTMPMLAFRTGPVSAVDGFAVYRNTVFTALVEALRRSYPTVDALLGADFFDTVAYQFAEQEPPTLACLAGYGSGFAPFLKLTVPELVYLDDVAKLDWAIDQTQFTGAGTKRFLIEPGVALELPVSLRVLKVRFPADDIRDAIGDDTALAAVTLTGRPRYFLLWRDGICVHLRSVRLSAATFIEVLLSDGDAHAALQLALVADEAAMDIIQTDILSAPFCAIVQQPGEGP
jgi:hypothetical protein